MKSRFFCNEKKETNLFQKTWLEWSLLYKGLFLHLYCIFHISCQNTASTVSSSYRFIEPTYSDIQLVAAAGDDSLHFPLSENTYNEIKSFNYFRQNGIAYISFYDRRSESVNIYDFSSQHRINKIHLKECFKGKTLSKTSVYVKNVDSIFVASSNTLYLIDSTGTIKESIDFYKETNAMAFSENTVPIIIKDNFVYMGIRPYINEASLSEIRQWRILYKFDLENKRKKRYYNLPEIYQTIQCDDRFFAYSYCYNEKGNFVFSFPADTTIYESNLADYHIAYHGKSRYQIASMLPLKKEPSKNVEGLKQYLLNDSYGPIYFDPFQKRYLRVFKQKINEAEYQTKNFKRNYTVLIFNQDFKIIGESEINSDFSYSTIFFTPEGGIYARANVADEYALHFIRLAYKETPNEHIGITKK